MNSGIFIDAHLLQDIRYDLANESGPLYDLIYWILDNCGIAMTPFIQSHWEEKISENDRDFWEWYYEEYHVNRRIREIPLIKFDTSLMDRITNDCHLPENTSVKNYIKGANSTIAPRYILSEHIYFYDPRYKEDKVRSKIVASRTGKLCKFLGKTLRIRIGSRDDCKSYFSTSSGNCPTAISTNCSSCTHIP